MKRVKIRDQTVIGRIASGGSLIGHYRVHILHTDINKKKKKKGKAMS